MRDRVPSIWWVATAAWLACLSGAAPARVLEVVVEDRASVLDGQRFGDAGAYEKLSGRVRVSFDPANPANALVTDLALAPVGPSGGVEAEADFMVLRPVDAARSSGVALLEVSNRGGKASLRYFNAASEGASDPVAPAHFGDGLLMRQGLTVIWVGWQFDVPDEPGRLRLRVPTATGPDGPVTGLVRSDWVIDEPVMELALGHRAHRPYPVFDPEDERNVLYVRTGRDAPAVSCPGTAGASAAAAPRPRAMRAISPCPRASGRVTSTSSSTSPGTPRWWASASPRSGT